MKIGIATDHRGVEVKKSLIEFIRDKGYEVIDLSPENTLTDDYVDFAAVTSHAVIKKEVDLGILMCGTGIGMSIAANKIKGIRCAKVSTPKEAYLTRFDNDANVLALNYTDDIAILEEIIITFITTPFSNEERHIRRIDKIRKLEE